MFSCNGQLHLSVDHGVQKKTTICARSLELTLCCVVSRTTVTVLLMSNDVFGPIALAAGRKHVLSVGHHAGFKFSMRDRY